MESASTVDALSFESRRMTMPRRRRNPMRLKPKRTKAPVIPDGLREAWGDELRTLSDLCIEFGLTNAQVRAIMRVHGWKERPRPTMAASIAKAPLPTEEEIAERAAQVRRGWSEEVLNARFCGKKRVPYTAPEYWMSELRQGGTTE